MTGQKREVQRLHVSSPRLIASSPGATVAITVSILDVLRGVLRGIQIIPPYLNFCVETFYHALPPSNGQIHSRAIH